MCPSSLKITLKALQNGAQMELAECLKMEYRIVCHSIESYNFAEGDFIIKLDQIFYKWMQNTNTNRRITVVLMPLQHDIFIII